MYRMLDYLFRANVVSRDISYQPKSSDRQAYCVSCDFPHFRILAGGASILRFPGNPKFPKN